MGQILQKFVKYFFVFKKKRLDKIYIIEYNEYKVKFGAKLN